MKLREQTPGDDELIAYRRPDDEQARVSEYLRVAVPDAAALREALDAAYGTRVVVAKQRRLLLWENVRIHLDEVEGLGSYMELEALAPDGVATSNRRREKVARLRRELEIDDANLVVRQLLRPAARRAGALLLDAARAVMRERARALLALPGRRRAARRGGGIHVGTNVENAAYPQSQCAEASAIGAMVAAGETTDHRGRGRRGRTSTSARPAAAAASGCRSSPARTRPSTSAQATTTTLGELLPLSFGVAELNA